MCLYKKKKRQRERDCILIRFLQSAHRPSSERDKSTAPFNSLIITTAQTHSAGHPVWPPVWCAHECEGMCARTCVCECVCAFEKIKQVSIL